jgi:hypothetical protein
VPKARPVKGDNAVVQGQAAHQPAGQEIGRCDGISVKQNHHRPFTPHQVVQANTIDINELASRRVLALGTA